MDKACTFFGHRECPESVKPVLRAVLEELILCHNVTTFYVGNQGQFDRYVRGVLHQLEAEHPHIRYAVVLPYMPGPKDKYITSHDTMLPEGIESVHPRYAITWRNRWMLKQADYVVTHITHSWGGAARFSETAQKQGKTVINIDGHDFSNFPESVLKRLLLNDVDDIAVLSDDQLLSICEIIHANAPHASTAEIQASLEQFWKNYYSDQTVKPL